MTAMPRCTSQPSARAIALALAGVLWLPAIWFGLADYAIDPGGANGLTGGWLWDQGVWPIAFAALALGLAILAVTRPEVRWPGEPEDAGQASAVVIVLACGPGENVLRLVPPLTISDADMDLGLDVLCGAISGA